MASTFSPNLNLELVGRGDQVGVWDTPENSDWSVLDSAVGAVTTISLNNANVVLSAAQFRSKTIIFNSTLTGSLTVFFPSSFTKSYEIINNCTGSSAFTIALSSPSSQSGRFVACRPTDPFDIINDGVNVTMKNLGSIGSYWDYAGSSLPNWVAGFGVNNVGFFPPYLNCDGTAFSSATYPILATILGGTTLPDSRGRARYALDAGVGRVSSAVSGVAGNTRFAGGGDQSLAVHNHTFTGNTQAWNLNQTVDTGSGDASGPSGGRGVGNNATTVSVNVTPSGTISNTGAGGAQNMPPVYIGGLTLIRAG